MEWNRMDLCMCVCQNFLYSTREVFCMIYDVRSDLQTHNVCVELTPFGILSFDPFCFFPLKDVEMWYTTSKDNRPWMRGKTPIIER